jgi:hypothetical protein
MPPTKPDGPPILGDDSQDLSETEEDPHAIADVKG